MTRRAVPADAAAVAGVHPRAQAGWAFADTIAPRRAGEAVWAERLSGEAADTWVLEREGRMVALASVCDVGDDDLAGQPVGEVLAPYVDPDAQRSGAGSALLEFAEEDRRGRGDTAVVLWVFAAGASARAFYEMRGYVLHLADGDELRHRRDL